MSADAAAADAAAADAAADAAAERRLNHSIPRTYFVRGIQILLNYIKLGQSNCYVNYWMLCRARACHLWLPCSNSIEKYTKPQTLPSILCLCKCLDLCIQTWQIDFNRHTMAGISQAYFIPWQGYPKPISYHGRDIPSLFHTMAGISQTYTMAGISQAYFIPWQGYPKPISYMGENPTSCKVRRYFYYEEICFLKYVPLSLKSGLKMILNCHSALNNMPIYLFRETFKNKVED